MNLIFVPLSFLLATTALAHDGHQEFVFGQSAIQPFLGLESTYGEFNFGGPHKGFFVTNSLRAEIGLSENSGIGARLPIHVLSLDNQRTLSGVGSPDFSFRHKIAGNAHGEPIVFIGLGAELPLGNPPEGIKSGHTEASPFISAAYTSDALMVYGNFSAVFALSGKHENEAYKFTYVAPHTDREIAYSVGSMYTIAEDIFASIDLGAFTALMSDPHFGGSTFYVSPGNRLESGRLASAARTANSVRRTPEIRLESRSDDRPSFLTSTE